MTLATPGVYRFPATQRLRKTDEFSSVFNFRRAVSGNFLQIWGRARDDGAGRLGLVVGKRVARQAVRRNFMKRVLREWYRTHPEQRTTLDVIVRVRRSFTKTEADDVRTEFGLLLAKVEKKCRGFSST